MFIRNHLIYDTLASRSGSVSSIKIGADRLNSYLQIIIPVRLAVRNHNAWIPLVFTVSFVMMYIPDKLHLCKTKAAFCTAFMNTDHQFFVSNRLNERCPQTNTKMLINRVSQGRGAPQNSDFGSNWYCPFKFG